MGPIVRCARYQPLLWHPNHYWRLAVSMYPIPDWYLTTLPVAPAS